MKQEMVFNFLIFVNLWMHVVDFIMLILGKITPLIFLNFFFLLQELMIPNLLFIGVIFSECKKTQRIVQANIRISDSVDIPFVCCMQHGCDKDIYAFGIWSMKSF